jgi:hypothetical protein
MKRGFVLFNMTLLIVGVIVGVAGAETPVKNSATKMTPAQYRAFTMQMQTQQAIKAKKTVDQMRSDRVALESQLQEVKQKRAVASMVNPKKSKALADEEKKLTEQISTLDKQIRAESGK